MNQSYRKVPEEQDIQIIATMGIGQPEGQVGWILRARGDRIIEVEITEEVSGEKIQTVLKKNELKPWQKKQWRVGPSTNAAYVSHMEELLDIYVEPYDSRRPIICIDEGSVQFISAGRTPSEIAAGKARDESCNIFLACEPLTGKRITRVTEQRTEEDFAHFLRHVIDVVYPEAEKIVLVIDKLITYDHLSFYNVFSRKEAVYLWSKLEIHNLPPHGNWLNIAEIELSVLGREASREPLYDFSCVRQWVEAWQAKRDAYPVAIDWYLTAEDAQIKFKRLYPVIKEYLPLVIDAMNDEN